LDAAANDADLAAAREALFLVGFSDALGAQADVIDRIEAQSVELGYPQLL
jgi:hypothetical protein